MAGLVALLFVLPATSAGALQAPPAANGELLFLRSTGGQRALYRVLPDGSQREELVSLPGDLYRNQPLDVSPDGRRLLWIAREPVEGELTRRSLLQVSNVEGGRRSTIRDLGEQVDLASATWSGDGLSIAYLAENRLYIVDAEGRGERRVPVPEGRLSSLHWSPAGDELAFILEDDTTAPQVWTMRTDGSQPRMLKAVSDAASGRGHQPTEVRWAPDGRRLAVLVQDPFALDCTFRAVNVVGADGTGLRQVTIDPPFTCFVARLTWSPDGTQFAVHAGEGDGHTYLHRFPAAGGTRVQLTGPRDATGDQLASWRPVPDLLAAACPPGRVPASGFADATGTFHQRGIDCAAWWGVAEGKGDGSYHPAAAVTRGQMASFVARALEAAGGTLPAPERPRFDDLDGSTHATRIEQLAEAGIVQGVSNDRFAPSQPITRAQMAAFLARAEAWRTGKTLPAVPDAFVDDQGHALQAEINRVASVGLTTGVLGDVFGPGRTVTRGQLATFLGRLLDRSVRDGSSSLPDG